MLRMFYTVGGVETDITKYVDLSTISVQEQINVPAQMSFSAYNNDSKFIVPVQRAYIRLYSTRFLRSLFTGFISAQPNVVYQGMRPPGTLLYQYQYLCTSDEYLLNLKAMPFIPAFVNQTQGQILAGLADTLCPGFFDTTCVGSGDIEPYFNYDPSQGWAEIAKTFADGSRYRFKARDKQIWFQPYGDGPLGVSYDDTQKEARFDPNGMSTQVLAVPTVNDITVIGDVEAGNNREDYFIGDGFTGNFPLRHKVFKGSSTLLLDDDWTENAFNTQQWYPNDPGANFNLGDGALNVVSSFQLPLGQSYLQFNNGIELAGGIDLEHGEFGFNDISLGIIGGLYQSSLITPNGFGATGCMGGFYISSPDGVETSASGAAGVYIQPTWNGVAVGAPVVTEVNHTYTLQTVITAPQYVAYNRWYRSLGGNAYGGVDNQITGNVTFIIQDSDIALATGLYYIPNITKVSVPATNLPAFAVYALLNNEQLNLTVWNTIIALMPLGALSAYEGPDGLWMPTGLVLPLLPPGSGGYIGGVEPWPGSGSGNIWPLPLLRQTYPHQEVLGNGFELQTAQVTQGNEADTLAFYAQTLPTAGATIRFQSWEAQAAISRLQASGSIAEEAWIVGDDGIRSAIVSNLNPLPRTSEDCDAAAQAFLDDRTSVFYNGTYKCTSYHFNNLSSDSQFWPTPGRYLYVNSPSRGINGQWMLVTGVTMSVLDAVGNAQQNLTSTPGQVGEVLQFNISFGADLHLEKVLNNFVDIQPPNVLTNQDTANPVTPLYGYQVDDAYQPDLKSLIVNPIGDTTADVTIYDKMVAPIEIRMSDANWGQGATANYVGTETGPHFTLVRSQFEQLWYMRFVDVATGTYSRRSKVIRIYMPQQPLQPTLISTSSDFLQFDFNGDIRNVYGFELRAADNTTILVQKPADSYGDLLIDLTQTKNTAPFTPNRTFYAYFFNHQWSYSPATVLTVDAPTAPALEEGYRFAQSLCILSNVLNRNDITQQGWMIGTSPDFAPSSVLINTILYSMAGALTVTVPASADLWVQSIFVDYIGSGAWSSPLQIPLGDLIASDYLAAQGSAPPILTSASGGILSVIASTGTIEVITLPFGLLYPNQTEWEVPSSTGIYSITKDTGSGLVAGSGYAFYLSMPSAAYSNPTIYVDGPYQDPSQSALAYTVQDGRVPLENGPLLIFTSTSPTGTSYNGGGGTGGGGNHCGVLSSLVRMADGIEKPLSEIQLGDRVEDGFGGIERVVGKEIVAKQQVRAVSAGIRRTRIANSHTLRLLYGWESIARIEEEHAAGAEWPQVATVDGMQSIIAVSEHGEEDVCHLQLSGPRHTYVLDGFRTHNQVVKGNTQ